MKAVQIQKFGGPEVLNVVDVEKPKPGEGQVLVKVYASSINPFDLSVAKGVMPKLPLPMILGGDIAGVVTELGENAEGFAVGNKVYGSANVLSGASGAFAEFTVTSTDKVALMPKNIDFNEAAAVVLTGVSAVQALMEYMQLKAGQKILIRGGAGGIGTMAIQIAKHIGAHITTTATDDGVEYVKKLGANEVIDYKKEKFQEKISGYDAVFDTVGGETFTQSFHVLKKEGILVSMVAKDLPAQAGDKKLAEKYHVTAITQQTRVTTERLDTLTELIEKKAVKPHIDKIFILDRIKEAFEEKEKGEVLGKIVIQVNS